MQFTVNSYRSDPYKNFRFGVMWDGQLIPGVMSVSPLTRTTEVIGHRAGNEPILRRSPGLTRYSPLVLTRGVTHDDAFERWANKVASLSALPISLPDFRKDVFIQFYNEAGQLAKAYNVYRCWPSEYTALSGLDADDPGVAIETLVLQNEGWARDPAVVEPTETSFDT